MTLGTPENESQALQTRGCLPRRRALGKARGEGALGRTLPRDPACSLRTGDHLVMVNGVSMENVNSSFAIQILKTCAKLANVVSGGLVGGPPPSLGPTRSRCPRAP